MPNGDRGPEQIGRYYDEWTARYQECFGDTFQACRPARSADLHRYTLDRAGIADGQRVLDAGCGVGGPSIYFASHRAISIDALTVSQHQVATARQLVAEAGLGHRITVHLGDFHKLRELFPPSTFDRVLFLESLSHAMDPAGPLKSAYDVLKPGGVVYIKDFFEKQLDTPEEQRLLRETIDRIDRTFLLKTPSLHHTVSVLTALGFRQQMIEPVAFDADNSVWIRFNDTHRFDLYGGRTPFQWCDWLELRFEKPAT